MPMTPSPIGQHLADAIRLSSRRDENTVTPSDAVLIAQRLMDEGHITRNQGEITPSTEHLLDGLLSLDEVLDHPPVADRLTGRAVDVAAVIWRASREKDGIGVSATGAEIITRDLDRSGYIKETT